MLPENLMLLEQQFKIVLAWYPSVEAPSSSMDGGWSGQMIAMGFLIEKELAMTQLWARLAENPAKKECLSQ